MRLAPTPTPGWVDLTVRPLSPLEVTVQPGGCVEISAEVGGLPESRVTLLVLPDHFRALVEKGQELIVLGEVAG